MSMIAVHGPYTFGSKAVKSAGPVNATVNPTDGTIWTFAYNGGTTRPPADFVWTYTPAGGAPASPINGALSTTIDFTTTGDKTVTLTVTNTTDTVSNKALTGNIATLTTTAPHGLVAGNVVTISGVDATFNGTYSIASAPTGTTFTFYKNAADVVSGASGGTVTSSGAPPAAAYPIVVTAVTGTGPPGTSLRGVEEDGEITEEIPVTDEVPEPGFAPAQETPSEPFNPEEHTVSEVQQYVTDNPDDLEAVYEAEIAGKNRTTLVTWLEEQFPYDPGAWTVQEVVDYAEANPDDLEQIIADEQAGKNRSTLLNQLEGLRPA